MANAIAEGKIRVRAPACIIDVNQKTIDNAVRADSGHCMVADAIHDRFPHCRKVSVDIQTIRFSDARRQLRYTYLTPRAVQEAIVLFDLGRRPKAFSFKLSGAQITNASRGSAHKLKYAREYMRKRRVALKKAMLKKRDGNRKGVPDRLGGKTPPISALNRRSFGLRTFEIKDEN